jgi:hypothetical protein
MRFVSLVFVSFLCVGCGDRLPTSPSAAAPQPSQFQTAGESITHVNLRPGATRMQIVGQSAVNSCYKFSVVTGQQTLVNETLGTCAQATSRVYDRVHSVVGLQVEVRITPLADQLPQLTWWIVSE